MCSFLKKVFVCNSGGKCHLSESFQEAGQVRHGINALTFIWRPSDLLRAFEAFAYYGQDWIAGGGLVRFPDVSARSGILYPKVSHGIPPEDML